MTHPQMKTKRLVDDVIYLSKSFGFYLNQEHASDQLLFVNREDLKDVSWRKLARMDNVECVWFDDFKQAELWFRGYQYGHREGRNEKH